MLNFFRCKDNITLDVKCQDFVTRLTTLPVNLPQQKFMKKITAPLLLLMLLVSCNQKTAEPTAPPADTISKANPIQQMNEAITRFPDSLLLRENLIQYYREQGNYEQAIASTHSALNKDSANARLWNILGTLLFENEDSTGSINAFESSVRIAPDPRNLIPLGELYAETKNPKAIEVANGLAILKKSPTDKDALFIKGLYYNYTEAYSKAIPFFDQCLAIDYSYMDAYREKGIALYNLGKYKDALLVLDKGTTLQNGFDEGFYWMGRCYEKLNNSENAIQQYELAIAAAQRNNDDNQDARDALQRLRK